jgi:hypothetical protein
MSGPPWNLLKQASSRDRLIMSLEGGSPPGEIPALPKHSLPLTMALGSEHASNTSLAVLPDRSRTTQRGKFADMLGHHQVDPVNDRFIIALFVLAE